MPKTLNDLVVFLIVTTILILLLGGFIITILFLYRRRQLVYQKEFETIRIDNEKNLLKTQLEIQEQTFQNISREIHDNISLSLTLAKLNLNTLDANNKQAMNEKVASSIDFVSKALNDLSDISRSLNSEVISQQGLIKALELEISKMKKLGWFEIEYEINGNSIFLDGQKELVIYRIVQESFNNILKHAQAKNIKLLLFYDYDHLELTVSDDGVGFNPEYDSANGAPNKTAGLRNMKKRSELINGSFRIESIPGHGTKINLSIPF